MLVGAFIRCKHKTERQGAASATELEGEAHGSGVGAVFFCVMTVPYSVYEVSVIHQTSVSPIQTSW